MNNKKRERVLNSKAMGAIVATSLLIVVTVVASIGFQGWFVDFESGLTTEVEKQSMNTQLRVDGIFGDILYLYSGDETVLSSLKIVDNSGTEMCSFSDANSNISSLNTDPSLVGWWTLDDEDSIIKDKSGNENHGTLYGTTRLLLDFENNNGTHVLDRTGYQNHGQLFGGVNCSVDGISGKGCEFDGVNGTLINTSFSSEFLSNSFNSISLWVKPNNLEGYKNLIVASDEEKNRIYEWLISIQNKSILFHQTANSPNGSVYVESNQVLENNLWNFITIVINSEIQLIEIYFNGNKIHEEYVYSLDRIDLIKNTLQIGGTTGTWWSQPERFFNGSIDEVAIYSKALSDVEVKDLYESQKAKFIEFKDSKLGKAVEFEISNKVIISNQIFPEIPEITISFWANPNDNIMAKRTRLLSAEDLENVRTLMIHLPYFQINSSSRIYWDAGNDGFSYDRIYKNVTLEELQGLTYWSFTKNATSEDMKIYRNSKLWHSEGGKTAFIKPFNEIDLIRNYHGLIDEVRIYNRTLTEDEIKDLYWYSIKNNQEGVNQLDISSCNLNKGETYNIVGFTNNQKVESTILKR